MLRRVLVALLFSAALVVFSDAASFAAEPDLACGTQENPCVVRAVAGYESTGLLVAGVSVITMVAALVTMWGQGD